jgi:hypothetical protein
MVPVTVPRSLWANDTDTATSSNESKTNSLRIDPPFKSNKLFQTRNRASKIRRQRQTEQTQKRRTKVRTED